LFLKFCKLINSSTNKEATVGLKFDKITFKSSISGASISNSFLEAACENFEVGVDVNENGEILGYKDNNCRPVMQVSTCKEGCPRDEQLQKSITSIPGFIRPFLEAYVNEYISGRSIELASTRT
jgi:hypothetical protein